MELTITLTEPLATELAHRASLQKQTPENLAGQLLGSALAQLADKDAWRKENQRRLELIRQSMTRLLDESEQVELDSLQLKQDHRLEASDNQLLAEQQRVRQLAEQLANDTES